MIFLLHLLGLSNMPTIVMCHLGRGAHPGSSAVLTQHCFESLVTMILRRYLIRLSSTLKIFCYCKVSFVPDGCDSCLKYSHTTHESKLYYRDKRHLNLYLLYFDFIFFSNQYWSNQTIFCHQKGLLKIVPHTNNKMIIYVSMGISTMTTMMMTQTSVMHHYFHL